MSIKRLLEKIGFKINYVIPAKAGIYANDNREFLG